MGIERVGDAGGGAAMPTDHVPCSIFSDFEGPSPSAEELRNRRPTRRSGKSAERIGGSGQARRKAGCRTSSNCRSAARAAGRCSPADWGVAGQAGRARGGIQVAPGAVEVAARNDAFLSATRAPGRIPSSSQARNAQGDRWENGGNEEPNVTLASWRDRSGLRASRRGVNN